MRAPRVWVTAVLALLPAGAFARAQSSPAATDVPRRPELLRFHDVPFPDPRAEPYRHELANGIPVFVVEDHTVPLVQINLALPIGDVLDPPERPGLAALTAAMMRRGGAGERDARAFDEEADYLAADLDSVGGSRRSGVSLEVSTHVLEPALDLLADLVLRPRFEVDRLELAQDNLRASLRVRGDDPLDLLDRTWRRLLWGPAHYRGRELTLAGVDRLDQQALADFHRLAWVPDGAAIAVSGDVEADAVVRSLDRRLGSWRRSGERPAIPAESVEAASVPPGFYWVDNPTPQGKLMLGHPGALRSSWDDADAWALMVMSELFGGDGTVSRLRSRLRGQESLIYRTRSGYGIGSDEPGLFEVFIEVDPDNAPRAITVVLEEMERLRREKVSQVELDLAKRSLIDAFPILFDSAEKLAGRLAEDVLLARPHEYWRQYRPRIARIDADDVLRVARKFVHTDQLRVLWVGPPFPARELNRLGLPGGVRRLDASGAIHRE